MRIPVVSHVPGRADVRTRRRIALLLAPLFVVALATPALAKPAPNTTITSGPAALTNTTTASFSFTSSIHGSTFGCSLDGAAATSCASPKAYSGLALGQHSFSVAAIANAVVDSSPAQASWKIDATPPSTPTSLTATTPASTSIALSWPASSDATGVTGYRVLRDGTLLTTTGAVTSYTDSTVAAATTHSYTVAARDGAGNVSGVSPSSTATTPATPPTPDTLIDSGPSNPSRTASATFTFYATVSGSTFRCALDASAAADCSSPRAFAGLAEGAHTFTVTATASGQVDPTPAKATWSIDSLAPTVPGSLNATYPRATSVVLTWAASTDAVGVTGYDVYRDGALASSLGSVTTYNDATVVPGTTYTYTVLARDAAGNTSAQSPSVFVTPMAAWDAHLTRVPYLTDLVGQHVAVNFATDQSGTTASIGWGTVGGTGACSPSTVLAAVRRTILVGSVSEYQWTAQLDLPSAGSYCYRPYLGATDLLGANSSPQFTTQLPFGSTSSFSFDVLGDWGQVDASGNNQDQANLLSQISRSGARFAVTVGDNGYNNGSQINYGDLQQTGADTSAIFGPKFWTVAGPTLPIFTLRSWPRPTARCRMM